jgi:hypothetical protein
MITWRKLLARPGRVRGGNRGKKTVKISHAHQQHHQDKGSAAAGVGGGMAPGIGHRQFFPGLKGADGLVLGAVVLEDPADIREKRDAPDIEHQEGALDEAVDGMKGEVGRGQGTAHQITRLAAQPVGQEAEKEEGHEEGAPQGEGDAAPSQRFIFLVGIFFLERGLGRKGQGLDAGDHGLDEDHRTPEEGALQHGVALRQGVIGLIFEDHRTVGTAHRDGHGVGGAHHDALQHGLAAYGQGQVFVLHSALSSALYLSMWAYLRRKRSTRPAVSMSFCLPVKKGWHLEQISTRMLSLVEPVRNSLPQAQRTVVSI